MAQHQSNIEREQDKEANYFAMCLLMPAPFVHAEADRMLSMGKWDEDGVREMAKTFQVSEALMAIRLHQLGRMFET